MAKEEEDQSFRVTDKRLFTEDGRLREEAAKEAPKQPEAPGASGGKPRAAEPEEAPPGTGARIDFPSYVLSYYTQSLVLLGEVPNPYTNKKEEDLEAARHTVDILGMLKDKTKGNLAPEEEQLLESVLYEVRMKYMAKINKIKLP
ncbi:MAG: DUF1844 domain-containing protein [Acidobacteriia bacterium]|nr:DUF1844 domain-containing protein [Terriglobia bacterium]